MARPLRISESSALERKAWHACGFMTHPCSSALSIKVGERVSLESGQASRCLGARERGFAEGRGGFWGFGEGTGDKTSLQVALLSITACGQGLNLQAGHSFVRSERSLIRIRIRWRPSISI